MRDKKKKNDDDAVSGPPRTTFRAPHGRGVVLAGEIESRREQQLDALDQSPAFSADAREDMMKKWMGSVSEEEITASRQKLIDAADRRVKEWDNYQRSHQMPTLAMGLHPDTRSAGSKGLHVTSTANPHLLHMHATRAYIDIHVNESPVGRLILELYEDEAPKAVSNFCNLLNGSCGFDYSTGTRLDFADSSLHRVLPGKELRWGRLNGRNFSSLCANDYAPGSAPHLSEERLALRHAQRGLISMCSEGPNTVGSSFSITLGPAPELDFSQVIIGHIAEGVQVLERIEQVPIHPITGEPTVPVTIAFCGTLTGSEKPLGADATKTMLQREGGARGLRRHWVASQAGLPCLVDVSSIPALSDPHFAP